MKLGEISTTPKSRAKIWVDLDNTPHVPFFAPILEELERRGYSTFLTARDAFQVCELADLYHLPISRIGRHYGRNSILKLGGLGLRAMQLLPVVLRERPNLALSHGSRAQVLCSAMAGIPCVSIFDYEFAKSIQFVHRNSWSITPDVIPHEEKGPKSRRLLTYPGIKEDVYVPALKADPRIRADLGLTTEDLIVTLRPPAEEAHYHTVESAELFRAAVEFLSHQSAVKMVVLPRNNKQADSLRRQWPRLFDAGKMRIPQHAVDGLNLIWNSDLVISGGGTMNREAAALRVPVYSVFRGRIGAVDRYLERDGRLVLLQSVQDVQSKIVLARRTPSSPGARTDAPALQTIVNHIEMILSANQNDRRARGEITASVETRPKDVDDLKAAISDLVQFAARSLPVMFDSGTGLFCYALRNSGQGWDRVGQSPRYTMMTLLGLQKYKATGAKPRFDLDAILTGLLSSTAWVDNLGDLGLLLWTCALLRPCAVEELCDRLNVKSALARFSEAGRGSTMELSWFLAGVCHSALAGAADDELLSSLAFETHRRVACNQGQQGIFGHQSSESNLIRSMRTRVGTFADQVYPIYGFSRFAQAFGVKTAVQDALRCASAICSLQGPLGQWWWHYDQLTGGVIGQYPVFSVHQAGMAPMALLTLSEVSGVDFSSYIDRGLRWLYGANELNRDFRDFNSNLIWRSIDARRYRRYWRPVAARLGIPEQQARSSDLRILLEARPYELGWLLYALAPLSTASLAPEVTGVGSSGVLTNSFAYPGFGRQAL